MRKLHMASQEHLLQLGSTLSRMLKKRFGKGPETCYVTFHSERLTIYMRNFVTPAEEVLLERNQHKLAQQFRNSVMERVFQQFTEEAYHLLHLHFDRYFSDWDYSSNTGILLVENKSLHLDWEDARQVPNQLLEVIVNISSAAHKIPDKLKMIRITPNILAIRYEGILLQTEKVLIQRGYTELLLERSFEIKQIYMNHKHEFHLPLGRTIAGIYMTWDYQCDECYLFFYLH
ncbi:Na-translocating system protein MpsC family protein [Bacillus sp. AK128]